MISDDYKYEIRDGVLTIFTDAFSSWWKWLLAIVLDTDLRPTLLFWLVLIISI